jgi:hypothetical protein
LTITSVVCHVHTTYYYITIRLFAFSVKNNIYKQNVVDEESKKVLTKCYSSNESKYGWCATCNVNSTKPTEPNYCAFDEEEEEDPSKLKKKV